MLQLMFPKFEWAFCYPARPKSVFPPSIAPQFMHSLQNVTAITAVARGVEQKGKYYISKTIPNNRHNRGVSLFIKMVAPLV